MARLTLQALLLLGPYSMCRVAAQYANSTTYPAIVNSTRNDLQGSVDTLLPGTNTSAAVQAVFAQLLNQTSSPGGAILISTPNNGTLLQSFGSGTVPDYTPFLLDGHFRIASNTKTFTGSAVLKLVSEGKLSLNDTWAKFYNGTATFPYADNITVEDMLGMTSGVFDYVTAPAELAGPNADPTIGWNYSIIIDTITQASNAPYFPPGQTRFFNYSNSNYIMLGHIIDVVSGMDHAVYYDENFIKPLNLSKTSYPTSLEIPEPHVNGYAFYPYNETSGIRDSTLYAPSTAGAAGAMISDLYDLRTWVENMVAGYGYADTSNTSYLREERFQNHLYPINAQLPAGLNLSYGLACLKLNDYYGHDGGIKGFGTLMFTNPTKNWTLIAVGNLGADAGPGGLSVQAAVEILAVLDPEGFPGL